MKTSQKISNTVIVLFWSTPSCSTLRAYKLKSDLLKKAVIEDKPVEVITHRNKTLKLKSLGSEAGKFFGLKSFQGSMQKILLNINDIKMVTLL